MAPSLQEVLSTQGGHFPNWKKNSVAIPEIRAIKLLKKILHFFFLFFFFLCTLQKLQKLMCACFNLAEIWSMYWGLKANAGIKFVVNLIIQEVETILCINHS